MNGGNDSEEARQGPDGNELAGRTAVVTGASKGIGAAVVRQLAENGARVFYCARDQVGVTALDRELVGLPGLVNGLVGDLSNREGTAHFLEQIDERAATVDILVNNVGQSPTRNFLYLEDEEWSDLLDLNLLAAMRCTRHFLPAMRSQRWGRIVMMASAAANYPNASLIDYAAGKAALVAAAKAIARKYGPDNVLVNSVLPGFIRTPMWERTANEIAGPDGSVESVFAQRSTSIPLGRFGEPDDIANLVAFLVSHRATYLTGMAIPVDGGWGTHI